MQQQPQSDLIENLAVLAFGKHQNVANNLKYSSKYHFLKWQTIRTMNRRTTIDLFGMLFTYTLNAFAYLVIHRSN